MNQKTSPFHMDDVIPQETKKSFSEMTECKKQNGFCKSVQTETELTSVEATGDIGAGQYRAQIQICPFCKSEAVDHTTKKLISPGWY